MNKKVSIALIIILLIRVSLSFWFYKNKIDHLYIPVEKISSIEGVVIDEPINKSDKQTFSFEIASTSKSNSKLIREIILVTYLPFEKISYGDRLEVRGQIKIPGRISSLDGKDFDYQSYLAKSNIFYTMKADQILNRAGVSENKFVACLLKIKSKFTNSINNIFPEPESSLASGLVISGKQSIDKKLEDEFRRAGIVHIVVLSGFNVTIVGDTIMKVFSFLPATSAFIFSVIGLISFSIMTGGGATVLRSVIMAIIALTGKLIDREYFALKGLLIAVWIMIMMSPLIIFYDSSFQLSFASTLGLILLGGPVEERLIFITERFGLSGLIASTLATQIFVMPLIMHLSGMFSTVALIVNVLVLPFIPITMLLIFLSGSLGMLGQIGLMLVLPFSLSANFLLGTEISVVHFFANLPFAAYEMPPIGWTAVLIWYLIYYKLFLNRLIKSAFNKLSV